MNVKDRLNNRKWEVLPILPASGFALHNAWLRGKKGYSRFALAASTLGLTRVARISVLP